MVVFRWLVMVVSISLALPLLQTPHDFVNQRLAAFYVYSGFASLRVSKSHRQRLSAQTKLIRSGYKRLFIFILFHTQVSSAMIEPPSSVYHARQGSTSSAGQA